LNSPESYSGRIINTQTDPKASAIAVLGSVSSFKDYELGIKHTFAATETNHKTIIILDESPVDLYHHLIFNFLQKNV